MMFGLAEECCGLDCFVGQIHFDKLTVYLCLLQ